MKRKVDISLTIISALMFLGELFMNELHQIIAKMGIHFFILLIATLMFLYGFISIIVRYAFKSEMKRQVEKIEKEIKENVSEFEKFKKESKKLGEFFNSQTTFNYAMIKHYIIKHLNGENPKALAKDLYSIYFESGVNIKRLKLSGFSNEIIKELEKIYHEKELKKLSKNDKNKNKN